MLNGEAPVCPGLSSLIIAVGRNWCASFDLKREGLFCWGYEVFLRLWGLTSFEAAKSNGDIWSFRVCFAAGLKTKAEEDADEWRHPQKAYLGG